MMSTLPPFLTVVFCVLREEQRQLGSRRRRSAGGTRRPGRTQPEAAAATQCHQAAQGGWAREEPHPEQHLTQQASWQTCVVSSSYK